MLGSSDSMSSVEEKILEQDPTCEEEVRDISDKEYRYMVVYYNQLADKTLCPVLDPENFNPSPPFSVYQYQPDGFTLGTLEQDATHEEEVRVAKSQEVYPQRALTFLVNVCIFSNTFYYQTHRTEMDK